MTIKKRIFRRCPDCGSINEISIWYSINAQLNPEDRQALLEDKINTFVCQSCNSHTVILTSLLYHDMERKYMAWFFPFEFVESGRLLDNFTRQGNLKSIEQITPDCDYAGNIHIVFDMGELIRYIKFRESLGQSGKELDT